mmetsp:Transcript_19285/g.25410  ORF Transcript_19285/g.25410 Transcript_19285/m.25410 type:complete len:240 (-) Transcript_19285:1811-2530(-)
MSTWASRFTASLCLKCSWVSLVSTRTLEHIASALWVAPSTLSLSCVARWINQSSCCSLNPRAISAAPAADSKATLSSAVIPATTLVLRRASNFSSACSFGSPLESRLKSSSILGATMMERRLVLSRRISSWKLFSRSCCLSTRSRTSLIVPAFFSTISSLLVIIGTSSTMVFAARLCPIMCFSFSSSSCACSASFCASPSFSLLSPRSFSSTSILSRRCFPSLGVKALLLCSSNLNTRS